MKKEAKREFCDPLTDRRTSWACLGLCSCASIETNASSSKGGLVLNRVVDEDCRTDNYGKAEGGSVHKKQQIWNHLASYSLLGSHSRLHCAR